ncbi:uncharacterized protein SCHCODRAFT_02667425 [Schizophyllum commune H4-8]|uniref:uncharacterized protein n=1 Tax=Schizophyllum commune (strain H4-8 / FGSC 9210) TaxID=578458 RepID=UPI002160D040|nr:uncharacterized protein SCHCODRAFT_02667425 [Schizophyllum commune H4-8]KAI5894418.1 hypothetical protein SCHCODRAFT_02667425 [Schizophyllum commune H4-8]
MQRRVNWLAGAWPDFRLHLTVVGIAASSSDSVGLRIQYRDLSRALKSGGFESRLVTLASLRCTDVQGDMLDHDLRTFPIIEDATQPSWTHSSSGAMSQPQGLAVSSILVATPDLWPKHLLGLVSPLNNKFNPTQPVAPAEGTARPEATFPAVEWQQISAQIRSEQCLPSMGPDSTERLIASFTAVALSSPGSFAHFDTAYACAVHPLDASSPGVHLLPRHRIATMLLTAPIDIREKRQKRENLSEKDVLDSNLPLDNNDDTAELHSGLDMLGYPADSIDDAHIMLLPHEDSNVALALACVARQEEIYSVMSSAIMQRRVFGITDALSGLALEPLSWTVRVVFGWISEGDEADDFEVCFAHAPAHASAQDHEVGAFDVADHRSASALARFLALQAESHRRVVATARAQIALSREMVTRTGQRIWRVDSARKSALVAGDDAQAKIERIIEWRNALSIPPIALKEKAKRRAPESEAKTLETEFVNIGFDMMSECEYHMFVFYTCSTSVDELTTSARSRGGDLFSLDTSGIHILAENYVRPYAWPPPDIPTRIPGAIALKPVITQYLLSLDFGSRKGDDVGHLTAPLLANWDQYCAEVTFEKKIRTKDRLPKIKSAMQARATIMNILPIVSRVAADARMAAATPRSRLSCDILLAECLRTEDPRGPHIRRDREVPFPRNAYFDNAHDDSWPHRASGVLGNYRDTVSGKYTLRWQHRSSNSSDEPRWLRRVKQDLTKTVFEAYLRRSDTVDCCWFGKRRTSCRDALMDASVLDAHPSDICDTVAFMSIPNVFDLENADSGQLKLIEGFRIIGQRSTKVPPRVFPEDYPSWTRRSLDEGFDVADPVLRRAREKSGVNAKGARAPTASSFSKAEALGRTEQSASSAALLEGSTAERVSSGSGDLQIPFLWLEDCSRYSSFEQGFGGARLRIISTLRFLAACKVYNLVVFALVTAGSHAHLLCGWGTEPPPNDTLNHVHMHIGDVNCPIWDLRDTSQAIRLCAFLIQLRDKHAPKVRKAFEAQKEDFKCAWNADPTSPRFQWTMKHQQASSLVRDIGKERDKQKKRFEELHQEREEIGRAMEHLEHAIIPDTDVPAYLEEFDSRFARMEEPDPELVELLDFACTQLPESCRTRFISDMAEVM